MVPPASPDALGSTADRRLAASSTLEIPEGFLRICVLASRRQRLAEARNQADEIVARARRAGEKYESEAVADAKAKREEMMEQTRRDIEAETRRAIQQIRAEVADLTIAATEKVTRKALDTDDQRRLVEEALSELDFAALSGEEHR